MANISQVQICNMSLSHVGDKQNIESITENTAQAKICNLWYDYSRQQSLEAYNWSFARKRLTLATHSDDPPEDVWGYRYQYPSDAVIMREIENPLGALADAPPYAIESSLDNTEKTIVTDIEDAIGIYTFDLQTTTLFSPFFVEMFSYALASHIAFTLTGERAIKGDMVQMFQEMQRVAPAINANESVKAPPRDADHIRGRV